jgi:hypothetical protein
MSDKPYNRRSSGDLPDRIHRLLACGLCRRVPALADDPDLLRAVETAEAFADGRATADDLGQARDRARALARAQSTQTDTHWLAWAVYMTAALEVPSPSEGRPWTLNPFTAGNVSMRVCTVLGLDLMAERYAGTVYPPLFDDVEPRPRCLSPEWRTDTAVLLARAMYESRDFGAMPILADALQDAGCDNADILDHCRGPGPHIRGCWVVDLVLGKE